MAKTGRKNRAHKRKTVECNPIKQKCSSCDTYFIGKNLATMRVKGLCPKCRNSELELCNISDNKKIQCPVCNAFFVFELEAYIKKFLIPYKIKDNCIVDSNYLQFCNFRGKMVCIKCSNRMNSQLKTDTKKPITQRPIKQSSLSCSDHIEEWWS